MKTKEYGTIVKINPIFDPSKYPINKEFLKICNKIIKSK